MRILVTVGTTQFDELIKHVDVNIKNKDITFQIASGTYIPMNYKYFTFTDNFNKKIEDSDIIITHSGAGSVYSFLEMKKKIIVVPNLERVDKHQRELAKYIEENDFAYVAWDLNQIDTLLNKIETKEFRKYEKIDFFKTVEIKNIINELIVSTF
jgi:beta-1,4-N-acetylglucosaminyltransferase